MKSLFLLPLLILNIQVHAKRRADSTFVGTGLASYYSKRMHGHRVSDGSTYDMNAYTCAHRTIPFGTLLRVVNKKNGKEVVVKVNDRGPHGKRLMIDLSNAAAEKIDMVRSGICQVDVYLEPNKNYVEVPDREDSEYLHEFDRDAPEVLNELEWGEMDKK